MRYDIPRVILTEPGVVRILDGIGDQERPSYAIGDSDVRLWVEHPERDQRQSNEPRYKVTSSLLNLTLYHGDDLVVALRVWRAHSVPR